MSSTWHADRSNAHSRDLVHLLAGTALGLSIGLLIWHFGGKSSDLNDADGDLARYREVRDFVRQNYVRELDSATLLDRALRGMVTKLDDYTVYYGPKDVATLERETTGHYRGIGVVFAQPASEARVLFALPNSPAAKAGLRSGDRMLRVAGRAVKDLAPGDLRALLGAPDRADLELALLGRDQTERTVMIGQDEMLDPTLRHARIVDETLGVGYVSLLSFSQESADEFDRAVEQLREQGLKALIIDVRNNYGGVLRAATRIANRFIREGLIVSHEGRREAVRYEADSSSATLFGMPLVVLVDGASASASAALASALQEHRAAVVVGSPTYGKGMVQQVKPFGDGEMVVKLITSYYYSPSHRNLERTVDHAWSSGLIPDVQVDLAKAEVELLHAFLQTYTPPQATRAEIAAWEHDEGRELYARHPADAQLETALALFRGEHPSARVARAGK
jgi:carboxyl-terminal processing protease